MYVFLSKKCSQRGPKGYPKIIKNLSKIDVSALLAPRGSQKWSGGSFGSIFDGFWDPFGRQSGAKNEDFGVYLQRRRALLLAALLRFVILGLFFRMFEVEEAREARPETALLT